ncbi:type II secretion system F family protein [Roseovarius sp.]|uniref:type II secretion system F family protein n=1 Tax=Roseovarius sp. TaxID=1486281 RepID=UPI003B5CACBE
MSLFLIALTASIATFTALVLWVLVHVDRTRRRLHARLRRGLAQTRAATLEPPRRGVRMTGDRGGLTARIEALLAQTGLNVAPSDICIQVTIAAVAIYGLAVLYAGMNPVLALGLAVALPVGLAVAVLRHARARYQAAFTERLPEALDIFARGLRAGRPIADSLRIVVETTTGPVQTEFARCHGEICLGTPLPDSLAGLYMRMRTAEIGFFAVATALQADSGGNLVETLENLAEQLRERRKLRKKARALSSEARASAMILAALPFCIALALFVLNGAYLKPLFTDPRGQVMAAGALTSVTLGVYLMARMGRPDV